MWMFPHDPFGQAREEYWIDRTKELQKRGRHTAHSGAMDALWEIGLLVGKVLTLPVWLPISLWRRLRKSRQ
jgi:hypothetical protein